MSRPYDIINNIADRVLNNTQHVFSSNNWTASNATFTSGYAQRYGNVFCFSLTLKITTALTANTEYELGTLQNLDLGGRTINNTSMGISAFGPITIRSDGLVRFTPMKNIPANANLYPRIYVIM